MQQDLLYKTSYRVKPDALTGAVIEISTSWDYYFVSGGTTITGIKTGYPGMQVCLEFKTETTLIQSSTLDLPAGEDLVAVIGDVYRFCETILGTWKCISGGGKSGGGSISDDPYGAGWILKIKPENLDAELKKLLDADAYAEVVKSDAE